jgi:aryl-alcohol dehydrogenase-like predicted oxidoreductase
MNATLPGLTKSASRLVLGVDNQLTPEQWGVFDDFTARGGNVFDTAFVYGGGTCETNFGNWLEARNVRDQIVLIGKGAHTPHCTPAAISSQLTESLERLKTGHVDVYIMHRDNPDVPVGEFVDVLNRERAAGRLTMFGGSNWSLERVQAANAYAHANGLRGFSVVSNQFSLARMIAPVWAGCLSASDLEFRAWLRETQTVLMPWSSQARGFFVIGDPQDHSNEELVRCWYGEDNFARLDRARELAATKGVTAIQIALAYVLAQPFPTFPLIGPRSISETASSWRALEVELTPAEVAWLNLERSELA